MRLVARKQAVGALDDAAHAYYAMMPSKDWQPFYGVAGAVAGSILQGAPVWLMSVGPPSCGKTDLLSALRGCPHIFPVGDMTRASLLSGTPGRDKAKGSTGGVLRTIGNDKTGVLVMKDFTSILSMKQDMLGELLGALRHIYDGEWERELGADGGRKEYWRGKVAFLTASTGEIDRHHSVMSVMGERFLRLRYRVGGRFQAVMQAMSGGDVMKIKERKCGLMRELLETVKEGATWRLDQTELFRLASVASFAARCRAGVVRDRWNKKMDLDAIPEAESPPRLGQELAQLYKGVRVLEGSKESAMEVVKRVAFDCMPASRAAVLTTVLKYQDRPVTVNDVLGDRNGWGQVGETTLRRALEELELFHVLEKEKVGKADGWRMTDESAREYRRGWEGGGVVSIAD